jgi:hypothetical protein
MRGRRDMPRDVGVRLDHLFECSLKEDLSAGGAEVDYGSYTGL